MWLVITGALITLSLCAVLLLIESNRKRKQLTLLMSAVAAYVKEGGTLQLPDLTGAPKELQELGTTLVAFSEGVDQAHMRDTEVSRVKSDFISTAAHQLRTPLTGIRWALEALKQEQLTESQAALVTNAMDKSRDLVAIVGTLLDISAIESGKYKYVFERVDMAQVASEVTHDFQQLALQSKVALFYEGSGLAVPPVRADRERIKWVLNNLIENAVKYTPANGTVRVSLEWVHTTVFVRVQDSGIGIAPADTGNIFERFYRASNAISKENKGNGLGLYIARTIATDHQGDLTFTANTNGPGTTFTLSLPVR